MQVGLPSTLVIGDGLLSNFWVGLKNSTHNSTNNSQELYHKKGSGCMLSIRVLQYSVMNMCIFYFEYTCSHDCLMFTKDWKMSSLYLWAPKRFFFFKLKQLHFQLSTG